jgi:hypothetical protein
VNSRSGDCMKDALETCRKYGVELHPTVLVAVVSAITLEGWQYELDPSISIMDHIDFIIDYKNQMNAFLERTLDNMDRKSYEVAKVI